MSQDKRRRKGGVVAGGPDIPDRTPDQEALATRARQQAVLAELGRLALEGLDLSGLMHVLTTRVVEALEVEYSTVLELLPDGRALRLRAGVGWKSGYVGEATVNAGAGSQAGYTLLTGKPVVVDDLQTETRFAGSPLLRDQGVVSEMSVVIGGPEAPFGVLGAHTVRRRAFTCHDVDFLQTLAHLLALAIRRARAEVVRRCAEEALRDSEARYRRIVETAGEGIWILDALNRTKFVNARMARMLGYRLEEMLGQPLDAFVDAEGRAIAEANFRARGAGSVHAQEFKLRRKDGSDLWASVTTSHNVDQDGQYTGVLAMVSDITARRRVEQSLRQFADRLRLLREIEDAVRIARSPAAIAQAALDRIGSLVPNDRASVLLVDDDFVRATIVAVRVTGDTRLGVGVRLLLDQCWTIEQREALRQGRARVVDDVGCLDGRLPIHDTLIAEGMRGFCNVPLVCRGSLIGTMNLASYRPQAFTLKHIEIAREVADHLAVAVQDARLYEAEQRARETAERLAARLRWLSQRLVAVQENERQLMARELHDEVGQLLTGLKLTLEIASREPPDGTHLRLGEAQRAVNDLIARVRDLSLALRPAMLDDLGLLPALLWHFERYTTQTGVQVKFEHAGLSDRLPQEVETAVYRLVQEALTNVARHARVTEAEVRVCAGGRLLGVQVKDEGVGFDVKAALSFPGSGGLQGMHERAALLGGHLTVDSSLGEGTSVTATLPLSLGAAVSGGIDA